MSGSLRCVLNYRSQNDFTIDFDLDIQSTPDNQYLVSVRSPAGEAQEKVALAYDRLTLDNRLKDVQIALLQAGSRHRQLLQPAEETVQRFGAELFDLLLTGNIRNRYDVSLAQAQIQQKGLRLRLCIDAPTLAALPWEFLYDERRGDQLCLSYDMPLVRYLRLAQPVAPLPVTPPLRVLAMAVSPSDLPALDLAAERQRMEQVLRPLQAQGLVELVWLPGQSWRDLRTALVSKGPWHIFHFIGHGGFDISRDEGVLVFADDEGRVQSQTATNVGHLLADHRVRTTFGGLRRTLNLVLLCNPPTWDAPPITRRCAWRCSTPAKGQRAVTATSSPAPRPRWCAVACPR